MHLRPTREHTNLMHLGRAPYLEAHLPSNTTTKACSTMKACHSMDRTVTEAMVVDNLLSETFQPEGILGLKTPR